MPNVLIRPQPRIIRMFPGAIDDIRNHTRNAEWMAKMNAEAEAMGVPAIGGMTNGAWTFVNGTLTDLNSGVLAVGVDTFKMGLLASTSNIGVTSSAYSALTGELSGSGYTGGGVAVTLSLSGTTSVTAAFTQAQWNASGGDIVSKWGFLYEVSGHILGYYLHDSGGANVTAADGNTFTVAAGNVYSMV